MKLLKKILNKLNGLYYPQEFLCLGKESFQHPLNVFIVDGGRIFKDITHSHLFTGYSPLVFTLFSTATHNSELPSCITIVFTRLYLQPNDAFEKKDAIAQLSLEMIRKQSAGEVVLFYYEGIKGKHRFLSLFHQNIIGLNNTLFNKKPGNIFLHDNLYKQVQIAYSVPRIISLITVSDGSLYNLFPTDLHGPVDEQFYACSLRHEGRACLQVEAAGRITISQVNCEAYKMVYSLGKNHMQESKPEDSFPFGELHSTLFHLPLPQGVLYYRELELKESFVHGIHKLLLFKIVSSQLVKKEPATLAHIHNVYATWRYNKGLSGNYLLR